MEKEKIEKRIKNCIFKHFRDDAEDMLTYIFKPSKINSFKINDFTTQSEYDKK